VRLGIRLWRVLGETVGRDQAWFSGLSHPRRCGEDVLRMLVTGGPPIFGGGGIPQRIIASSRPCAVLRMT
jgi:hypothetical protein